MTTYLEAEVEYHTDGLRNIELGRLGVTVEYAVIHHLNNLEWLEKQNELSEEVSEA